jgi:flagellar FliJ protein
LQKIVDYKQNEKTQAEWLLSEAIALLRREEATLKELEQVRQELYEQLHSSAAGRLSISEMRMFQTYVDHIDRLIEQKTASVRQAVGKVEERQEGLKAKMQEEKVWLKARDNAYRRFMEQFYKSEQRELDDIALTRHSG